MSWKTTVVFSGGEKIDVEGYANEAAKELAANGTTALNSLAEPGVIYYVFAQNILYIQHTPPDESSSAPQAPGPRVDL
jgi:hypothetical protein